MTIYGVALLALSMLLGLFLGNVLGALLGVEANVGGVGIAMLTLIIVLNVNDKKGHKRFKLSEQAAFGISFWSAMYIPIVVAMAAKQNVIAAVSSGPVAFFAGFLAVAASFAMVPIMSRWGDFSSQKTDSENSIDTLSNKPVLVQTKDNKEEIL